MAGARTTPTRLGMQKGRLRRSSSSNQQRKRKMALAGGKEAAGHKRNRRTVGQAALGDQHLSRVKKKRKKNNLKGEKGADSNIRTRTIGDNR